jgi:membrane protein DedA with SNARE-associated domain
MDVLSLLDILRWPLDAYHELVALGIRLARDLFAQYGYIVLFLGVALENTLFLGAFIPGMFVLLLAGVSTYSGLVEFPPALVVAIVGTSLGDTLSYWLGRLGNRQALRQIEKSPWVSEIWRLLERRPVVFILCYHFLGYTRLVGPMSCGVMKIPFWRWWALDLLGASVWVTLFLSVGYALGAAGFSLDDAEDNVRRVELLLLGLAVVGVIFAVYMKRRSEQGPPKILEVLAEVGEDGTGAEAAPGRDAEPSRPPRR